MADRNSNVSLKKKVTLRQKQTELPSSSNGFDSRPNSKKWLWLIPVVIVMAGGALFIANQGGKDEATQVAKVDMHQSETKDNFYDDVLFDTSSKTESEESSSENEDLTADEATANNSKSARAKHDVPETNASLPSTAQTTVTPASKATSPATSTISSSAKSSYAKATLSSSIDDNALRVVRGEFGNGNARKEALGDRYTEIQSRVNEMYREGRFN